MDPSIRIHKISLRKIIKQYSDEKISGQQISLDVLPKSWDCPFPLGKVWTADLYGKYRWRNAPWWPPARCDRRQRRACTGAAWGCTWSCWPQRGPLGPSPGPQRSPPTSSPAKVICAWKNWVQIYGSAIFCPPTKIICSGPDPDLNSSSFSESGYESRYRLRWI